MMKLHCWAALLFLYAYLLGFGFDAAYHTTNLLIVAEDNVAPTNSLDAQLKQSVASKEGKVESHSSLRPIPMPWIRKVDPPPAIPNYNIQVAIATVSRDGDLDYLLQVLESLDQQGFPHNDISVYFNALQGTPHRRWTQGSRLYPNMTFYQNDAPAPPRHPAIYDKSIPPPFPSSQIQDGQFKQAQKDTESRKEWRRKECWDFVRMMQHQLYALVPDVMTFDNGWDKLDSNWTDPALLESQLSPQDKHKLETTFIIFNQDDGKWLESYQKVQQVLPDARTHDFFGGGMVSIGFRADALLYFVQTYAPQWCDFKPVDWILQDYFLKKQGRGYKVSPNELPNHYKFVEHIGHVSTMIGRIEGVGAKGKRHVKTKKKSVSLLHV